MQYKVSRKKNSGALNHPKYIFQIKTKPKTEIRPFLDINSKIKNGCQSVSSGDNVIHD